MSMTPDALGTHAYHLIVQRPDGAGFASTSHDHRQFTGSMTLEPNIDLRPRELAVNDQLFGSFLELEGGLGSQISPTADLRSGHWRGAAVRLLMGDWWQEAETCTLAAGEVGRITLQEERLAISVDLRPDDARQPPCIQTSPECRAVLGDRQCRMDMRSRKLRVTVVAALAEGIVVDTADIDRFGMGRLRWISGSQCGLEDMIVAVEAGRLVLRDAVLSSLKIGDTAILTEGCDGRRSTCSERFGNILNFRGEPDLPGSEIIMRLPGA
jgi:uncharacterized phage protein (TIGR02218 family)